MNDQELQRLWRSQPAPHRPVDIARLASDFEKSVRRRTLRETLAAAIVVPLCLWLSFTMQSAMGVGLGLLGLGVLVMLWQLRRRTARHDSELGAPLLAHHRLRLVREQSALRSAWLWYLGPMLPGLTLFLVAYFVEVAPRSTRAMGTGIITAALSLATFIGIAWMNARAARRVGLELDALDREG